MKRLGVGLILIVAGISFISSPQTLNENNIVSVAFAEDDKRDVHSFKIFTGDGPPPQKLGHSNDLYIDQASEFFDVYVKNDIVWELVDNLQGPAGEAGPQGEQGPAGPQGEQGPKGEDGTKISSGTGDPNGVVFGNAGDFFIDTETGDLWQLGEDLVWIIQGNIKGPKGDTGDTGTRGEAGLACWDTNENGVFDSETEDKDGDGIGTTADCQGMQGEKGEKGDTGPAGPQGNAGLNSVILTTQLPIDDANCQEGGVKIEVGLDSNGNNQLDLDEINSDLTQFVCNGVQGQQGPPGPPGPQGVPGPAFLEPPLSHYRFEQNVLDSEGGNHGTVTGTETYVPGQKAFAFDFDGLTHIETADAPFDFTKDDAFSVSTWVRTGDTGATDLLVGKIDGGIGYQIFIKGADEQLRVRIGSSPDAILVDTVGANVRDNNWHHVALTYDGSSSASGVTVYVDGVAAATTIIRDDLTGSILSDSPLTIGNQNPSTSFFFTGQMDDVRIYDFELTSSQVSSIAGN